MITIERYEERRNNYGVPIVKAFGIGKYTFVWETGDNYLRVFKDAPLLKVEIDRILLTKTNQHTMKKAVKTWYEVRGACEND
jgi:hypothetical protein